MINFAIVGAGAIAKLMATTIKMMNKGGDESVKLYAIASRSLEKAK
ncbi:MAG TPA: gfo/Idh/MocA family oxidoreductase, partial [Succinivibrio sp.]|nr:gfo/Idh/MocA family oxidoreductase [Succinivibrio sp.]